MVFITSLLPSVLQEKGQGAFVPALLYAVASKFLSDKLFLVVVRVMQRT